MTDKGIIDNRMAEPGQKTNKINIEEAVNEFYKMKDKYETSYKEKYLNPILKAANLSKREKKAEFVKLPKAECINCKRNVGTVFSITRNSDFIRKYIAKCGDLSDPCPLNINIHYGTHFTYETDINKFVEDIDRLKSEIIKEKYNMMFGYVQDEGAIQTFEELSKELKQSSLLAGSVIEKNILVNDNPDKAELLKKSIDIFGKEYVLQFKQMIKQYVETGDELVVDEAVKFYKNEMMPRIKEIQELKYEINMVEFDPEQYIFSLRQRKNSLQNLEYSFSKDDKIIALVKGSGQPSRAKTMKNIPSIKPKNKTRKSIMLVEEAEAETEPKPNPELGQQEEKAGEYVPVSPKYIPNSPEIAPYIVNFDNTIEWNNEKYKAVWETMSSEEKELLLRDPDLMKETLETLAL